jgi:hypothetical protein
MEPRRSWVRVAITLVLSLAALTALFPGAVLRGESFWVSDLGAFHRPIRSLLLRLAHESGGLPIWNPYLALGQPYAANPHYAVFHPTTALFFFLPFETAFRWQVMLPVLVAFVAMVFFLRTLHRSFAASLFGGICWALGGSFLSGTILLPIALTIAPMPATLAFAVRLARAESRSGALRETACLALSFGVQCLAGEPGSLFITMGLACAALCEVYVGNGAGEEPVHTAAGPQGNPSGAPRRFARGGARLAAAFALGIGVAGASLLPGAALGARSSRAIPGGIPASQAAIWSMPPARALEVVFPRTLGYLDRQWDEDGWYWGASSYPKRGRPFLFSLYGGAIAAMLAAAGIARRPKRFAAWLAAAAVGSVLALGPAGFLWTIARRVLPLFANVRYPERWFLGCAFVIATAAAFGFDALCEGARRPRRIAVWGLAGFGAAAAAAAVAARLAGGGGGAWFVRMLGLPAAVAARAGGALARDFLIAAVVALAGSFAATLMSRGAGKGPDEGAKARATTLSRTPGRLASAAAAALLLFAAADLIHAFRPFASTAPVEELGVPPPTFQRLIVSKPSGPIFHYASYDLSKNLAEDRAAPPVPALWGLATTLEQDFDISELAWSRRGTLKFFEASTSDPALVGPLLARRGVAAIVKMTAPLRATRAGGTLGAAEDSTTGASNHAAAEAGIEILRPNGSLPFLICLPRVEIASGEEGWLAAVHRLGDEAARTAVLDPSQAGDVPLRPAPCDVTLAERTPVHLAADVRSAGPEASFLAIDQTWDRGWRASIDGRDAPLLRTDIALSALLVPMGAHRIELVYEDPWIARGAVVSMVSLALCAALVLIASRRDGARRPPTVVSP